MRRKFVSVIVLLAAIVLPAAVIAQMGTLPRSTPESQGISSVAVARFIDSLMALPDTHIQHVVVARHGTVVAEAHPSPFRASDVHTLYSESKTFTSMAVGLAIDDGNLRLDDHVADFFPDDLPDTVSPELAQMTVRDLLTMTSGVTPDWVMRNWSTRWARTWLAKPVREPGKTFMYDSMCTYMLSAIVQRATGYTVLELLGERIFAPMGITVADWELSPDGICTGGWGLRLQAESQAKLGILLLGGGAWQGKQLVSRKWVEVATSKQVESNLKSTPADDGNQGYCFQIWRCKWPGAFRADGAYGQYVVCVPDADLVVVINALSYCPRKELDCIWRHLMPGVAESRPTGDRDGNEALRQAVERATLPLLKGKRKQFLPEVDGSLPPNATGLAAVRPVVCDSALSLVVRYSDFEACDTIPLAYGGWAYSKLHGRPPYSVDAQSRLKGLTIPFEVAGNYAWTSPSKLEVQLYYVNMISRRTLTFDFNARTVTVWDSFARDKRTTLKW